MLRLADNDKPVSDDIGAEICVRLRICGDRGELLTAALKLGEEHKGANVLHAAVGLKEDTDFCHVGGDILISGSCGLDCAIGCFGSLFALYYCCLFL